MAEGQRTVLVIGGTGGIGGSMAAAFVARGDHVIVTGATAAEADAAVQRGLVPTGQAHALDVRSDAQVAALIGGLARLDVLINAAGIASSPQELTIEGFVRAIDINLNGTARACFAAYPLLKAAHGSIVNIASVTAFRGTGTGPGYSASKGGVVQLTKSLAAAWAPEVRVNAIAPGFIRTPMTEAYVDVLSKRVLKRIPAGRWGESDELASGALYLTDPGTTYVTGVTLPIDGGFLAI